MFTSFLLHRIVSILFLLVIPLPFVALIKSSKQTELRSAVIWQYILRVTNIGLVVILITGITLYPVFSSVRLWVAIGLTLAAGGLLGIISKELKQYNTKSELNSRMNHLKRVSMFGFGYLGLTVIIFGFMAYFYQI